MAFKMEVVRQGRVTKTITYVIDERLWDALERTGIENPSLQQVKEFLDQHPAYRTIESEDSDFDWNYINVELFSENKLVDSYEY